jgi:hypothetical protein
MHPHETRLVDADGERRLRTVVAATFCSAVVLTGFLALVTWIIAPEHGVVAALAIGALSGIWVSVLGGGVIGNGIHEARQERAERGSSRE